MEGYKSRLIGLDLLRFFVTTIVLSAHAAGFGNAGKIFFETPGLIGKILRLMPSAGWVAVDIFFVLSGFLVSGLLFEEAKSSGTISIKRFLIRRGFKIYPAFWAMLGFSTAWLMWHHAMPPLKAFWSELFYFQNYGVYVFPHTWSLAVEEHFYFLLAGIFWIFKRRSGPKLNTTFDWIPNLFLMVAVSCLLLRIVSWWCVINVTNENRFWLMFADHAVLDALFFGVLLSHYWHNCWDEQRKRKIVRMRWVFAVGGLALMFPGIVPVMDIEWFRMFGFILVYLGAGALVLSCLALDYVRYPVFTTWLAWLGRHSYSVYLWHITVGSVVFPWVSLKRNTPFGWAADTLIYFALCWLAGIFMARVLELPMLRVRDRLFPRG